MEKFTVQFTNGTERRCVVTVQPDAESAVMYGLQFAPWAFSQHWNKIADQSKWSIVVISENGERNEEPATLTRSNPYFGLLHRGGVDWPDAVGEDSNMFSSSLRESPYCLG